MDFEKQTGTVIWFNARKGFGFIKPDDALDDKDIFAHYSGIDMEGYRQLKEGDRVEYALKENDKGTVAVDIKLIQTED